MLYLSTRFYAVSNPIPTPFHKKINKYKFKFWKTIDYFDKNTFENFIDTIDLNYNGLWLGDFFNVMRNKYYEEGKSELVPKDETNYVDERDEYYDIQNFTVAGSNVFTLAYPIGSAYMITVFVNNIKKIAFSDFNVSGNILTLTITPANGIIVNVCMNKKRYYNNDSDKFQQFTYDFKSTYLINSSGELVRRENKAVARTALVSDDFDTFENTNNIVEVSGYSSF